MLKRKPRCARPRLPADGLPPVESPGGPVTSQPLPWREPVPGDSERLWLCILPAVCNASQAARLAALGTEFTPQVSVQAGVLLEVGASLRLFGGLESLRERLWQRLQRESDIAPCMLAVAPTPSAASWLARAQQPVACLNQPELRRALDALPPSVCGWSGKTLQSLDRLGVRTLGECRRLPRDGFARRLGKDCLHALEQAYGERPQPLRYYRPPAVFSATQELPAETHDSAQLLVASEALLGRLGQFLRRRQLCVETLYLQLSHQGLPVTQLRIGLAGPCLETRHLGRLIGLRLERETLPAGVLAMTLRCVALPLQQQAVAGLPGIEPVAAGAGEGEFLVDRLRARLGRSRVYGLRTADEHRPERAWRVAEPGAGYSAPSAAIDRPLWLLPQPRRVRLDSIADGPAQIERIESGWWDGEDIRRDYYRIQGPHGSRWWVYRDLRDAGWYLHGLFG